MPVLMMDVGKMQVRMPHRLMLMRMDVRLLALPNKIMKVPMMLVVNVQMSVFQAFVPMSVLMALRYVQPYPPRHQDGGR
jgi:hypothetical protein